VCKHPTTETTESARIEQTNKVGNNFSSISVVEHMLMANGVSASPWGSFNSLPVHVSANQFEKKRKDISKRTARPYTRQVSFSFLRVEQAPSCTGLTARWNWNADQRHPL
jgi:hypothetical protein